MQNASVCVSACAQWIKARSNPPLCAGQINRVYILKTEPEVLRYGEAVRKSVQQKQKRWDDGVGYLERETLDAFLKLPAPQRKIIREVILAFAKAHDSVGAADT